VGEVNGCQVGARCCGCSVASSCSSSSSAARRIWIRSATGARRLSAHVDAERLAPLDLAGFLHRVEDDPDQDVEDDEGRDQDEADEEDPGPSQPTIP
jgi:hypothetical protein